MSESVPCEHPQAILTRFAWLSVAGAVATISIKTVAYLLTGSVGLLSDALESTVNLLGAVVAVTALAIAAQPPDNDHAFGHDKVEYFSSGFEGSLILLAAIGIIAAAIHRIIHPQELERLGAGVAVSVAASLVNLGIALVLKRAGRKHRSVTLEANAQHLLTDVWTSAGVIAGLGVVSLTGFRILDPILALAVGLNIIVTGVRIIRKSILGLLDTALPPESEAAVTRILDGYKQEGMQYHALRTRQSGRRSFVDVHVLVPGIWTVESGHQLLERIENDIRKAVPGSSVFTHLESLSDPASWEDIQLDRKDRSTRRDESVAAG